MGRKRFATREDLGLTKAEFALLRRLDTPAKIQAFLYGLKQNFEPDGDTCNSVRVVLRRRRAHCIEGATLAACALWVHGEPPLLLDLQAVHDFDHVVALFRRKGRWGAISKTNGIGLRWRDPVYRSLRGLAVPGKLTRAWLDHEWSTALLEPEASGWDWIGINLDDGGALMAFRMRDREGKRLWAAATLRRPGGDPVHFAPQDVVFLPGRRWTSPRTGIQYPVEFAVRTGDVAIDIEPLMDDQESDSRMTTGAMYWEGAVRALQSGRPVGKGYLELTGYGAPLALPGSGR